MAYTGDASIDFVSQFHNLEGSRIGERKKNFFKLLRDPKWSNEQQLGNVLQNLQPKTYLENLFWVDALIHFKRTPELLEILKQGNEVFISKILKAGWFFEGAFKDMDAEVLVNEFLPCTSFAVRMKLLKRICRYWNGERIDALFDSLEKRYGIFVSSTIFHTCSAPKIKEVLRENDIKLRSNQVKHLFDRDAELFTIYLDHINLLNTTATGTKAYGEAKVLNHIALRNPKLLLELEKSKKINFRRVMGRRTSKKIVKLVEEDILKDPKRYTSILNNVMIVRQLGSKFEIIYRQLFPQKISGISMNNLCNELLVLCPKSRRWDLFAKTYSKVFPTKNIEHLFLNMDDSFLKLNPTKRIVSRWSEKNYYAELSNFDDFLKYFKTSKAIPILKKKINFTSDLCKRASLVILLLENCAQHKDLDALEGVLNYVYSRHRNDDRLFRCQFYDKLNQLFNLDDLNENHWKHIHDLISFDMIKATYSFLTEPLLHKYLEYLLNREDSEESLREYMKDCCEFNVLFNVGIGKPLVERRIMLKMCELFPDLMEGETEKFQKGVQFLIENLVNFSIANVEYCVILSDFPYLVSFIKDLFSKEKTFDHGISCLLGKVIRYQIHFPQYAIIEKSRIFELILHAVKHKGCAWPYTEILKEWICRKDRSDFNEVSALYLKELFEVSPENNIIIWLLKNEPESLVPYFEKILQKIPLNRSKGFGKELKLYSHFDFDSKAADFYGKQLEQKKCEKKREILKILVELLSTDQFVELVNDHLLPQKDKIELQDKKMRKIYSWQFEVSKILHEVHEPYKVLLLVMKFSIGDYLQSVLTSLYGVFYKSPEKLLHPHVEVLEKRGLSTRKHAVFLSCEVLDKKYALERLETAKQSEVVSSKHLFSAVLKYFKKNPSQELIQMINLILPKIDMYDSETFGIITSLTVPNKYKSVFIVNYWNFFHHLKVEEDKKVSNYLQKLLDHISADILKSLSSDFIHFLIYSYLGSKELAGFERFVLKILEYRESERNHNFPFVFKELSVQKKTLSSFLRCFIDLPKENEEIDRDFVNTFVRYWNGYFPILGNCREHVALKLFLLRLDHRTTEELAQKICIYLEELSSEFGPHIFMLFKTEFEALIDKMEKAEKYILFHNILKYKCTTFTCILVLDFIDLVDLDEENLEIMQYYASIIGRVKQVDEPIVHIYYKSYFNTCDLAM